MEIIFVSSLDATEEERLASVILATVNAMLVDTSLAYTLRIRTSSQKLFQQSHAGVVTPPDARSAAAMHGAMKRS
ncbi:MAG TPA: hypothetical protein VFK57_06530 [Vicinamibacterales bacterium]|nr:hypothetical protein [Vicinamibacterales bacterium]